MLSWARSFKDVAFFIRASPREGRKEVERRGRPKSEIKARAWEMIIAAFCVSTMQSCVLSQGMKTVSARA